MQEPTLGALDMGGQVATFISGVMAHEKSAHIAEQVGLSLSRIRENGAFHGRVPFGMMVIGDKYGKRLLPTDEGRLIIPQVFQRVVNGESLRDICRWLESEGIKPKTAGS